MEDIVKASNIIDDTKYDTITDEKVSVFICRFWPKHEKRCKKGQVYFVLTSKESERMLQNVLEGLRKGERSQEVYNVRSGV